MRKKRDGVDWEKEINELSARFESTKREKARVESWKKGFEASVVKELEQGSDTLQRADAGDPEARALLARALDEHPAFLAREGSLALRAEEALLDVTSSANWLLKESRRRMLRAASREIAGPNPSPLEAALAQSAALAFAEVQYLQTLTFRSGSTEALDKRLSRAHARAMSAAKTLAVVRRLAAPVVQLNIAEQQVNVAAAQVTPG